MGEVMPIRPTEQMEAERAAKELVVATRKLARAMTRAARTMPSESLAGTAGAFLAETRNAEMARPARLVLEAVAGALLAEFTHSAIDEADELPDDDPEEVEEAEIAA